MKKLPIKVAEKVYEVLIKFAEASQNFYDRESFVYHFGVVPNTSDSYDIVCVDGNDRIFTCTKDQQMWIDGKDADRVNAILQKISSELTQETLGEFTIVTDEIQST